MAYLAIPAALRGAQLGPNTDSYVPRSKVRALLRATQSRIRYRGNVLSVRGGQYRLQTLGTWFVSENSPAWFCAKPASALRQANQFSFQRLSRPSAAGALHVSNDAELASGTEDERKS